jgi:ATP-dependent helicase/nuclease subunit A
VGTEKLDTLERLRLATGESEDRLNPLTVLAARSPLHWLAPTLGLMRGDKVAWNDPTPAGTSTLFTVRTQAAEAIQRWALPREQADDAEPVRRAVASLSPLPSTEPLSGEATGAEEIIGRLEFVYPHLALSTVPAARAASEANRGGMEEERAPVVREPALVRAAGGGGATAAHRGQVVHTALQFLRLERTSNEHEIAAEIERLRDAGVIAEEDVPLIDTAALEWFHNTGLGMRIRAVADRYHREWMFLAAEPAETFDPAAGGGEDDRVLVRGVVDGVLASDGGVEIVDFKTDRVPADGVEARASLYSTQMRLYISAVEKIFGPVTHCHLVFLHSRRIVTVEGSPN